MDILVGVISGGAFIVVLIAAIFKIYQSRVFERIPLDIRNKTKYISLLSATKVNELAEVKFVKKRKLLTPILFTDEGLVVFDTNPTNVSSIPYAEFRNWHFDEGFVADQTNFLPGSARRLIVQSNSKKLKMHVFKWPDPRREPEVLYQYEMSKLLELVGRFS